jgi:hypothetical protein
LKGIFGPNKKEKACGNKREGSVGTGELIQLSNFEDP